VATGVTSRNAQFPRCILHKSCSDSDTQCTHALKRRLKEKFDAVQAGKVRLRAVFLHLRGARVAVPLRPTCARRFGARVF
jgi:hypothetical protein